MSEDKRAPFAPEGARDGPVVWPEKGGNVVTRPRASYPDLIKEIYRFICNCRSCCCLCVRQIKEVGNLNLLSSSNFISVVHEETCTGRGDCVARCPVNAMSLKSDETAAVDGAICIGWGNCVTICLTGSLFMERRSNKKLQLGNKVGVGPGF